MVLKVFADTNVWFSALYGSINCEKILDAYLRGKISLIMSKQVLNELIRNIQSKAPDVVPALEKILISHPPEIVRDPELIPKKIRGLISYPDQGIFMACQNSHVEYFIIGYIRDFKVVALEKLTGIKILTPKEAVEILGL